MQRKIIFLLSWVLCLPLIIKAQTEDPTVNPQAYYTNSDQEFIEATDITDGQAPLAVEFRANPSNLGEWVPSYEWHFRRKGSSSDFLVRYDENTSYTFNESGSFVVILKTYLKDGGLTAELDSVTLSVNIAESRLEFPNAFSPNGDGINDIYRAKRDYKSIISFRAIILNRWGQKLYEWNDPEGGWDGTFHGHDVKQGVYYVFVEAKGADGREYKIKKDVNLLRGYTENNNRNE